MLQMRQPGIFVLFSVFLSNITSLQQIYYVKNVHPVYRTGIQTHNLLFTSIFP